MPRRSRTPAADEREPEAAHGLECPGHAADAEDDGRRELAAEALANLAAGIPMPDE